MKKEFSKKTLFIFFIGIFSIFIISGTGSSLTQDDLLAYWSFNDGTAKDSLGKHNGTLMGNTYIGLGYNGNGVVFDGNGDYVKLGNVVNDELNLTGKKFSMAAWVNWTGNGYFRAILFFTNRQQHDKGLQMGPVQSNGRFNFALTELGGTMDVRCDIDPEANKWYHVAGVYNGSALLIYLNGILCNTKTFTGTQFDWVENDITIGARRLGDYGFNGTIDEVMIFNKPLNSSEIADLYNGNITGNAQVNDTTAPLINFTFPTPVNGSTLAISSIEINVSASDSALSLIRAYLFNSSNSLIAIMESLTSPLYFVFNNLSEGNYSFYAQANDSSGNLNSTETRTVRLAIPPVRFNGSPSGNIFSQSYVVNLSLNTDENAVCKYENISGISYDLMSNLFNVSSGTLHSSKIGVQNGSHNYYVKCADFLGNANNDDYLISFNFNVPLSPPTAVIEASLTQGEAPLLVKLNGTKSNDPDGAIVSYFWDFGDGANATGIYVEHTYNNSSTSAYKVALIVRDNDGLEDTESVNISVGSFAHNLFVNGLAAPTAMKFAPDGRLFVTEQSGNVRIIKNGLLLSTPFLTLNNVESTGERGLLGIDFDPNFETNGYLYLYYTKYQHPDGVNRVSRFKANFSNPDMAETGSEYVIIDGIGAGGNHNGGAIHFGLDKLLYIAVGDNANSANAQNLSTLMGKMLRINVSGDDFISDNNNNYVIPINNPFVGQTGARGEIWAYGLRNPFTFAVDSLTGKMHINDVGERTWEEINPGISGANYGWPNCEGPYGGGVGDCTNGAFTYPIFAYDHLNGNPNGISIIGGVFYRGSQFPAKYQGDYFFGDYGRNWMWRLNESNNGFEFLNDKIGLGIVGMDTGQDEVLYYVSRGFQPTDPGEVYRISFIGAGGNYLPKAVISANASSGMAPVQISFNASLSSDPDGDNLSYFWDFGDGANATGNFVEHTYTRSGQFEVILNVVDSKGGSSFDTLNIIVGNAPAVKINVSLPGNRMLYHAGDVVNYSASAVDIEDGILNASSFTWEIILHHNDTDEHTHPFISQVAGIKEGNFTIPVSGEDSSNVFYRFHVQVKDSDGLTNSTFYDIHPQTSNVTLNSNPNGLQLILDGVPVSSPYTFTGVVGFLRSIGALSPQNLGGISYQFANWSDNREQSHTITTPENDTQYTAAYNITPAEFPEGLISYWSFDDGTAKDLLGKANGTLIGNTACNVQGKSGFGCKFDGSGDYIDLGLISKNGLNFTGKNFTISAWVNLSDLFFLRSIFSVDHPTPGTDSISLQTASSNSLGRFLIFYRNSAGVDTEARCNDFDPVSNRTYHVVGVRNDTHISIWVDGKYCNSAAVSGQIVGNDDAVYIGNGVTGGAWNGMIDEVMIFNKSLTDLEIQEMYAS